MLFEKGYKTNLGGECLNICLRNHLNYLGLNILGCDILFLGDGFKLQYEKNEALGEVTSGKETYYANYRFLERIGVHFVKKFLKPENDRKKFLIDAINSEKLITIAAMSVKLEYNRIYSQGIETVHFINPIGYDSVNEQIYISDGYTTIGNANGFEGWVSTSQIMDAWSETDYFYIIIENDASDLLSQNETDELFRKKLLDGLKEYMELESRNDKPSGRYALRCFVDEIDTWENDLSVFTKERMINLTYRIKIYGLMACRLILKEIKERLNLSEEIGKKMEWIIKEWNELCFLIIKLSMTKKQSELIKKIQIKIQNLIQIEESVIEEIISNVSEGI